MAAWQFSVVLIPRGWAEENNNRVDHLYQKDGYVTGVAWAHWQPTVDFPGKVSKVLPESKSWHNSLLTWGNTLKHDIQIWYENDLVESVCIRFSLRHKPEKLIGKVLLLAEDLNCVFFFPETKAIENPTYNILKSGIINSNAAKFLIKSDSE